jgi:prepilin-type N-terminal cleavage/methylation domain-containing protein
VRGKPGFTLIELLIVIVILAVLMVIGLGSFNSSQTKSRDSRRKTDLQNVARALEVYYNDKGEYPISSGNAGIAGQVWGNAFVDPDLTDTLYMQVLPPDPSKFAYYYESTDGSYFQMYAYLENENDQSIVKDAEDVVMVYSGTDCVIGSCNYGIASTNTEPAEGHPLVTE